MKNLNKLLLNFLLVFSLVIGSRQFSFAQPGTHLHFDGVDDWVTCGNSINTVLDPLNTITVEAWVNPETAAGSAIIVGNYSNPLNEMQFLLRRENSDYKFWVDDGTGFKLVTATNAVILNTWQHLAGVWDGATLKIYVDGVLRNTTIGVTGPSFATTTNQMIIGSSTSIQRFLGKMDEVRIWTSALSNNEIVGTRNCELSGTEPGLLAYYKFNHGIGGGVNTGVTTLTNSTVTAGLNGLLTNFALTGNASNWLAGSPITTGSTIPSVNSIANQSLCNGSSTSAINFSGAPAGTSYNWVNNNAGIGLAASGSGNIAVFTATNSGSSPVIATVTVTPAIGGIFAYIVNGSSNDVSVINTVSNTVVATIAVGSNPRGVSASTDGSRVYVANFSSNNVSVINTASNTVTATITVGSNPYGIAVSPDGSKIYAVNLSSNNVSVINTATNTVVATVAVGGSPTSAAVSPDGSKVYVTGSNSVFVINTVTNTMVATISVGSNPYGIAISPNGSRVYAMNVNSNDVSVINTATNTVVATVAVGSGPFGASVIPDGSRLYVANGSSSTVSVINTATNTVLTTVTVGSGPVGVSAHPDGRVYVANAGSNNVSIINSTTNTVVATVAVGSVPASFGNFIANVPGCTGAPRAFTLTVNPLSAISIALANTTQILPVSGTTIFSNNCIDLIASVLPNGASPINGNITAKVWIEGTQASNFVKRHYEITPATGAATATAKVTLYFTQAEFDDFNAVNTVLLPTGAADATGKANLLIEKRSGVSSDGSGFPGTYTGTIVTIDPVDVDIFWNVTANRWELSFDVTGFSGFFVKTINAPLPLNLLAFNGSIQSNNDVLLQWQTTNEINSNHFEIEVSSNGNSFVKLGTVAAKNTNGINNYQFADNSSWTSDVRYYRLKLIDNDGRFKYSTIIRLSNKQQSDIRIYPNPVKDVFTLQVTDNKLLRTTAALIDVSGKLIKSISINNLFQIIDISLLAKGMYLLKFEDGSVNKIIKE